MQRSSILFLLIATLAGTTTAADLSLDEAIRTALENSPAIRSAAARAAAATARSEQADGFKLPSVDLLGSYSYTNNPAEVFALTLNQGRFDMEQFFTSDPNSPDPLSNWLTRLEVTWPVYTGGELGSRVAQAEHMASAEELELAHARELAGFETTTAFTNLAKARDYLELMNRSRETTAEHVRLAERYSAQGLILEADLLQARVHLAEMDELVAQAVKGTELTRAALNFQMGIDQSTEHALAPLPPNPAIGGTLDDWVAQSAEKRRDLQAARRKLEAGRLEEKVSTSGFKPEVAVVGRYDLYDHNFFGAEGHSGSVMAVAKINLYRGGSDSARLEAAKHDTASAEADIDRFEEGIRLEARQAWHEVTTARTRHAAAAASVRAAEEALRVREHRFKQGLDRMIDLVDAETALRGAEVRDLVARYDVALATYKLQFSSGATLLDNSMEVN